MRNILLITAIFVTDIWSIDVKYSLKLRNENAFLAHDIKLQKAVAYGKLELEFGFEDDSKIVIIGTIQGDAKDNIEPRRFLNDTYSNASKNVVLGTAGHMELREFYYEMSFDDTFLKIGKIQSVWGKADGIKLIDKLNPQDFSEFILAPFDESRIPLWSLSLQHRFQNSEIEFIWIPDTTYHKIPRGSASYAFSSSRLIPKPVEGIDVNLNEIQKPDEAFKDSDIALRYSIMLENMELSFYGLYAYEDTPVLYQDLDLLTRTVNINPEYKRSKFLGMSIDYSTGDLVYRLESGITLGKYFLNTNAHRGIEKSDEFSYIFGIDWYGLDETLLSMQINQSYLLSNESGFTRPKVDNTITFLYKKEMMNNTFHAEILAIHNINDGDGLVRPKLSYELDEESLIYTWIDYFYGDRDGLYGQFEDQSRVVLGIERTF